MIKRFFLLLLLLDTLGLAANNRPLAILHDAIGGVYVLRNPVIKRSREFDRRANLGLYEVTFYMGRYWESYPIVAQSPLFYGDLISTKAHSSAYVDFHGVHGLRLSENTVVQLIPNFLKILHGQPVTPILQFLAGKARISSEAGEKSGGIELRSSSMMVELGKSDVLFAVKGKSSQLICIEGKAAARKVSKYSLQLYLQSVENYRNKNYKELTRLTNIRHRSGERTPLSVPVMNKIEAWEEFTDRERGQLYQMLGADEATAYLRHAEKFEASVVKAEDLKSFADLLPEQPEILEKIDFHTLGSEPVEEDLFRALAEEIEELSRNVDPISRLYSIHLAYLNTIEEINQSYSFEGRAMAIELELRPWRYIYTYLGFSSGKAHPEGMKNFLGIGKPKPLNSYSQFSLGLGGRLIIGRRVAFSAGVGLSKVQRITIQYDDLPSNINRIYTIVPDFTPLGELGFSVNFFKSLEFYLRAGLGTNQIKISAKDIASSYRANGTLKYGMIGLGLSVD